MSCNGSCLRLPNPNSNPGSRNIFNLKSTYPKLAQVQVYGSWWKVFLKKTRYWQVKWQVSLSETWLNWSNRKLCHPPPSPLIVRHLLQLLLLFFINLLRSLPNLVEILTGLPRSPSKLVRSLLDLLSFTTTMTHIVREMTLFDLTRGITRHITIDFEGIGNWWKAYNFYTQSCQVEWRVYPKPDLTQPIDTPIVFLSTQYNKICLYIQ